MPKLAAKDDYFFQTSFQGKVDWLSYQMGFEIVA